MRSAAVGLLVVGCVAFVGSLAGCVGSEVTGADDVTVLADFAVTDVLDLPDSDAVAADADVIVVPGGFGWPCTTNGECLSGFCLPTAEGHRCTVICEDECPGDFVCKPLQQPGQDPVFVCVDVTANLCRPCDSDDECNTGTSVARYDCADFGDPGGFCLLDCGPPNSFPCPEGYACQGRAGLPAGISAVCTPVDGTCECNGLAVSDGASTTCHATNGLGRCPGQRTCLEAGLSDCDAPAAVAETCNNLDDNCDGTTDNPVGAQCCDDNDDNCDDNNACTADTCEGAAGCKHANVDGKSGVICYTGEEVTRGVGACSDGVVGCSQGTSIGCVDQVQPSAEMCNGQDDDCDGETDEGTNALCFPYMCGATACATTCSQASDCFAGYYCDLTDANNNGNSAECVLRQASGSKCSVDTQCLGGTCSNGYCCASKTGLCCGADSDCASLTKAATCDNATFCAGHRVDATCDAASVCQTQNVNDTAACLNATCGGPTCIGGNVRLSVLCSAQGSCNVPGPLQEDCGGADPCCNYTCSGAACAASVKPECIVQCSQNPGQCACQ
ncbi:MAG: hypothetical protein R3F39_21315 [Myxococcota bacterium]